ncbi:MAG: NERD domain-containing protein [Synergistes sp.]|nr:NERD domain-containing protein [Synergistes sp.]
MIEMIPDLLSPEIKSQAEKSLFNEFRDCKTEEHYIILHSLGLSDHVNNIFGEIDFVVICHQGVLCVEVKGGDVSCNKGVWKFTNRYGKVNEKTEGPFQQVQGNMQSLRGHLMKRLGKWDPLVSCQYASCVIMPDCEFKYEGIEIIPEILFDKRYYRNLPETIEFSFSYWRNKLLSQHGFEGNYLSENEMKRLADILRGDFHFVPSMKDTIDLTVKALCALTDEQYDILESLDDNDRVLVSGVAGAGKTLLAMEQARRVYWSGRDVLFVCFNRSISSYVQYQFEKDGVEIKACTFHSLLGEAPGDQFPPDYFGRVLPEQFLKQNNVKEYDYLIIDEGQDLFKEAYLPCLGRLVKGGLNDGNWLIFYDQNQNLFNNDNQFDSCIGYLKRCGAASFKLTVNCRNTRQIVDANTLTTGITNIGRPKVNGLSVQYLPYNSKADERKILENVLQELKDDGVNGGDLIILSRYSLTNPANCLCGNPKLTSIGKIKSTGQMWRAGKTEVRFSTVSAFKGLEAKVVILTDVDSFSDQAVRLLNYVAISRASSLLYVLYDSSKEQERQDMLISGYFKI